MVGCIKTGKQRKLSKTISTMPATSNLFPAQMQDYGLTVEKVVLKNDRGEETSQFRPAKI